MNALTLLPSSPIYSADFPVPVAATGIRNLNLVKVSADPGHNDIYLLFAGTWTLDPDDNEWYTEYRLQDMFNDRDEAIEAAVTAAQTMRGAQK